MYLGDKVGFFFVISSIVGVWFRLFVSVNFVISRFVFIIV